MLFSLYRLGCPVAKTVAARLRKIPNINRSVLKKRAACIGTVQNEGDWAQPNKHFAKQKWHLYRQKPCLPRRCFRQLLRQEFLSKDHLNMRCRRSYSIAYAKVPHDAKNTRLRNGKEYIYSSLRF